MTFQHDRDLLNPSFVSYKLSDGALRVDTVPFYIANAPADVGSHLSWKDLRSRARWNGLVASEDSQAVTWIESAPKEVWSASLTEGRLVAQKLFGIPQIASSSGSAYEEPTLCTCGSSRLALSDGNGALHIITEKGRHIAATHLSIDGQPKAFRLHACDTASSTALLSRNMPREGSSKTPATFEVVIVRLPQDGALNDGELEVLDCYRGADIPSFAYAINGQWIVGADGPFEPRPSISDPEETSRQQLTAVSRPNETSYSWLQTTDSVDIQIPLTSNARPENFKIAFSPEFITVVIGQDATPRFSHRKLWAPIDAGACNWTWQDDEGLLTLHLEKKDVNTRWTALFAVVPDEGEVAETLSEEQLSSITASLDKYTADTEDLSTFKTSAGLLGEEGEDVDEDDAAETTIVTNLHSGERSEPTILVGQPLPRCGTVSPVSLLIKRSYDGLLFAPSVDSRQGINWRHVTNFPALSYVLASKRNLRYRFFLGGSYAIALDGGGLPASSGAPNSNAYVYWPPPAGKRDQTAKQALISLSGAVVRGAVALDSDRVVVLCDGELKLLSGFAN